MELHFKGANCLQITTKNGVLITDPKISLAGLKDPSFNKVDVCLLSAPEFQPENTGEAFIIDCPGEYEVKGFAIKGVAARAHVSSEQELNFSTVYRVSINDINVAVFGHIYPELDDVQLESLGTIDIMTVPVGGNGYTLDPVGATKLVRMVDPKLVIPTHYADEGVNYEVPQQELEAFIKELGAPQTTEDKLKLKKETLGESLLVCALRRS